MAPTLQPRTARARSANTSARGQPSRTCKFWSSRRSSTTRSICRRQRELTSPAASGWRRPRSKYGSKTAGTKPNGSSSLRNMGKTVFKSQRDFLFLSRKKTCAGRHFWPLSTKPILTSRIGRTAMIWMDLPWVGCGGRLCGDGKRLMLDNLSVSFCPIGQTLVKSIVCLVYIILTIKHIFSVLWILSLQWIKH